MAHTLSTGVALSLEERSHVFVLLFDPFKDSKFQYIIGTCQQNLHRLQFLPQPLGELTETHIAYRSQAKLIILGCVKVRKQTSIHLLRVCINVAVRLLFFHYNKNLRFLRFCKHCCVWQQSLQYTVTETLHVNIRLKCQFWKGDICQELLYKIGLLMYIFLWPETPLNVIG